ncbi:MAG: hypothetical protein V4459_08525 [Pseudomonadota bacterium]
MIAIAVTLMPRLMKPASREPDVVSAELRIVSATHKPARMTTSRRWSRPTASRMTAM